MLATVHRQVRAIRTTAANKYVTRGMSRRAKIVCTLGPSTMGDDTPAALIEAGMDVARLNLSYGTHDEHRRAIKAVRRAADRAGRTVAIMADVRGRKLRIGRFAGGSATLREGDRFSLVTEQTLGSAERVFMGGLDFSSDLQAGEPVLLRDGRVELEVREVSPGEVVTRVVRGGVVTDHAGVNLPGTNLTLPALTDSDVRDLKVVLEAGIDLVALSFVRCPEDAEAVRSVIGGAGKQVPVIAKIERPRAVDSLENVTETFDGLMVARGDLGIELPLEEVPLVQKRAITTARRWGRPVIVATEMLESMIKSSRPTRAEASDVANAVLDGADALMLSAETAVGDHPIEVVRTMVRIVEAAERGAAYPAIAEDELGRDDAVARAAVDLAGRISARSIAVFTESGSTAQRVARHRPSTPIAAFTSEQAVACRLALTWGVRSSVVPRVSSTDEMVRQVDRTLVALGHGSPGDQVVIVAGVPIGVAGSTNLIRVHTLEEL